MSSILKALKKLEKDDQGANGSARPQIPVNRGGGSGGFFSPALKIAGLLLLLAGMVAGGLYFHQKQQKPEPGATAVAVAEPPAAPQPEPQQPEPPPAPKPRPAEKPKPDIKPGRPAARKRERPAPPPKPEKKRPKPGRFEGPGVHTGSDGIPNPSFSGADGGDQDPAAGLKLQALAWSDDPDRRFAVINARIVKEGGRIAGMTVMEINPDQVILRQGDEDYTLEFTLK